MWIVFVGRNGVGKFIFMKFIMGVLKLMWGEIFKSGKMRIVYIT